MEVEDDVCYTIISHGYKNPSSQLGTLYSAVTDEVLRRPWWKLKKTKKVSGRFHLLLGEAQASTIPFKQLSTYDSYMYGITPLCNYYRGFMLLCRKSMMVKTLKEYLSSHPNVRSFNDICPESFVFYPSKPELSQTEALLAAEEVRPSQWILKPSDGGKGHNIVIVSSAAAAVEYMQAQPAGSIATVVQRYLSDPLLIPNGNRKFDIRVWVLIDSEYRVRVYRQGVLRVAAARYDPSNIADTHSHLSNHCIAETHPDYGKYEPTNEIWFDEFDSILCDISGGAISLHEHILPQIHSIIATTIQAARPTLYLPPTNAYHSFNVLGYDFMLTQDYRVWLLEINSSPALAEELLPRFTQCLVSSVIDRIFPPPNKYKDFEYFTAPSPREARYEGFEILDLPPE